MGEALIIAAPPDDAFAREVQGQLRGLRVEVAASLPPGDRRPALLVWSAAQPVTVGDVPALVERWSEGRLAIVRRDDTPLPLGLGDLESLPPGAAPREAALKVLHAALAPPAPLTPSAAASSPSAAPRSPAPPSPPPAPPPAPRYRGWIWGTVAALIVVAAGLAMIQYLSYQAPPHTVGNPPSPQPRPPVDASSAEIAEIDKLLADARQRQAEAEERLRSDPTLADSRAVIDRERFNIMELEARRRAVIAESRPPVPLSPAEQEARERELRAARELAEAERLLAEQQRTLPPAGRPTSSGPRPDPPPPSREALQRIAELEQQVTELRERSERERRERAEREAERERAAQQKSRSEEQARIDALEQRLADQRQFQIALATGAALVVLAGLVFWWVRRRMPAQEPPATGDAPPVLVGEMLFVSYAHRDLARVDPIVSQIEALGRPVWIDRRGIVGGPGWAGQIARAIKESRAVVFMASPSSYGSDQVVRELYLAMSAKKRIVPIELEPSAIPDELEYILAPFQRHALGEGDRGTMLRQALERI